MPDLSQKIGSRITVDRHAIQIAKPDAGRADAVPDRLAWETGPVLDAAETLPLGGRGDPSVLQGQAAESP